jgi:hypothetical protein
MVDATRWEWLSEQSLGELAEGWCAPFLAIGVGGCFGRWQSGWGGRAAGRRQRQRQRRPAAAVIIDVPSQNSPSPASSFFCTRQIGCRYARTPRASIKDVEALLPPTHVTAIGRVPSDPSCVSWGSGRAPDPALSHFRPPCRAIGHSCLSSRSPCHHGRPRPSSPSTPVLLRWALQNPPPPRARCAGGGE